MKKLIFAILASVSISSFANGRCMLPNPVDGPDCRPPESIPVLIYHRVITDQPPSDTVIAPDNFSKHMDKLMELGYTTVTIAVLEEYMKGKISLPAKTVAITFDDGWKDNLVSAEILLKRNLSATFYVMSGVFESPQYLSKDELKKLSSYRNFQIGAHSHTHFMEWEGKMESVDLRIIVGEMSMSKAIIEETIGKSVTSFAWPFGYFNKDALRMSSLLGFSSTSHVNSISDNKIGSDPVEIKRLNINGNCTPNDIQFMLETRKIRICQ